MAAIAAAEYVKGFLGAVAADEPQAVLVGRDILALGGTAVDAATAMYFVMAVTLPSRASLGGGGVCIAFDAERGETRALRFLADPSATTSRPGADRPSAVPAAVRGFYVLHGRYGRLRWSQVLGPAEGLARFGAPVSRAFAADIDVLRDALLSEPTAVSAFASRDGGRLAREGDILVQMDLAATLGRIRTTGPAAMYVGAEANALVDAVRSVGGTLERADLDRARPEWQEPLSVPTGNHIAKFPPAPPDGGVIAAQMWAMLVTGGAFEGASAAERPHLLIETGKRAFAERGRWPGGGVVPAAPDAPSAVSRDHIRALLADYRRDRASAPVAGARPAEPANPTAATLVAADPDGNGVACAVTLNSRFGTGRVATGTGILLASEPDRRGRDASMLAPMLIVNENINDLFLAGAASGGVVAPTSLVAVAASAVLGEEPLSTAIAAARVHGGSDPQRAYVEPAHPQAADLGSRGHALVQAPRLGSVNILYCPKGIPPNPETCQVATDPRGFGLAAGGGRSGSE